MNTVEEFAAAKGLPTVSMLPYEALSISQGNPMIVQCADGSEVLVRLMTAGEYLALQHAEAAKRGGTQATIAQARELTRVRGVL
jgi:hypothetical protein